MTAHIAALESQRDDITTQLFRVIRSDRCNPIVLHATALRLARVNGLIAAEREADASSADPLEVVG